MKKYCIKSRAVSISLVLMLTLVAILTSCNEVPTMSPPEADTFKPATDLLGDGTLQKRYSEYLENSTLAFTTSSPMGAENFEYEIIADGVKINSYIGEDGIIVVPEVIDGVAVTHIGEGAFSGGAIRAVYIPDSVTIIEKGAFSACDGLATLRLPFIGDGGDKAFLGYIFGADAAESNAISVPPSLDMVIIGEKTVEIKDEAFLGCKTLSAVVLPDSVESIGNFAFYECADLCFVSLGASVKNIGEYAFAYCSYLYYVDCSMADSIATGAFIYCSRLNGMKISLADGDYLGRLFGATTPDHNKEFVPDSLRRVEVAEGCTAIPDRAFTECYYIMSVTLPETLGSVGVRAFYSCRSLENIDIPDKTKIIGDDAFFGCDGLCEVSIGEGLEELGMQAFYGCISIESISLPESLKEIKSSTFYNCVSLSEVELGGVKKIGKNAFKKCNDMSVLNLDGIEVADGNEAIMPEGE